ncbi:hypothetical protein H310_02168 [Aphanomyces invadans]|uniref:Uncharacterized protein n=1 Tax=Aphanomyces invadans TaxID=157072 RepID=A0A024UMN0_9STRA|nr:hypothetical protein H310_02168 [Aphanomyces invadans]ETW07721.1 hypothetical protein H310_02168 [Aphanomyces invadans]|eukprot:XP_008863814.1 hypothetical protein H310_02168 [Aphanomyces invadans]
MKLCFVWVNAALLVGRVYSRLHVPSSPTRMDDETPLEPPDNILPLVDLPPMDFNYLQWFCESVPFDLAAPHPPLSNDPIYRAMWSACKAYFGLP